MGTFTSQVFVFASLGGTVVGIWEAMRRATARYDRIVRETEENRASSR
jgi:hypothetical protein